MTAQTSRYILWGIVILNAFPLSCDLICRFSTLISFSFIPMPESDIIESISLSVISSFRFPTNNSLVLTCLSLSLSVVPWSCCPMSASTVVAGVCWLDGAVLAGGGCCDGPRAGLLGG